MKEFFLALLEALKSSNREAISLLAGFAIAWLLFEVTEWRRVGFARRELRRALLAEMETAEVLVSTIIGKYARLCHDAADVAYVASEIRWFQTVGRQRMQDVGIVSDLPAIPTGYAGLSDDHLIKLYSSTTETIGTKIILPVVERALAGQTLGLGVDELRALGMVRWQAYLLGQDADSMKEMFALSFAVIKEEQHKIVVANHDGRTSAYAHRARTLLRAIRAALQLMRR
jgi:hypothetical protein